VYKILVRNPEGGRPLETPNQRWVHVKMDIKETGHEAGVEWNQLVRINVQWRALVATIKNLRIT
jgi:hypothetical protein